MADYRFPSLGVDARFPGGGVDAFFPSPGVDGRFVNGVDLRFTAPGVAPIDGKVVTLNSVPITFNGRLVYSNGTSLSALRVS